MSADPVHCAIAILLAVGLSIGATALKDWQASAVATATPHAVMAYHAAALR